MTRIAPNRLSMPPGRALRVALLPPPPWQLLLLLLVGTAAGCRVVPDARRVAGGGAARALLQQASPVVASRRSFCGTHTAQLVAHLTDAPAGPRKCGTCASAFQPGDLGAARVARGAERLPALPRPAACRGSSAGGDCQPAAIPRSLLRLVQAGAHMQRVCLLHEYGEVPLWWW